MPKEAASIEEEVKAESASTGNSSDYKQAMSDIQAESRSNEIPGSVKGFLASMIGLLVCILALICNFHACVQLPEIQKQPIRHLVVEVYSIYCEATRLQDNFNMFAEYQFRYRSLMLQHMTIIAYQMNRLDAGSAIFFQYFTAINTYMETIIQKHNTNTRKQFATMGLDYDLGELEIKENGDSIWTYFSHGVYLMLGKAEIISQINDYTVSKNGYTINANTSECVTLNSALEFITVNGFNSLRLFQEHAVKSILSTITSDSDKNELTLLVMIILCSAAVLLVNIFVFILLYKVIKRTKAITGVFALVIDKEIAMILANLNGFDLGRLKGSKWGALKSSIQNEDNFWERLLPSWHSMKLESKLSILDKGATTKDIAGAHQEDYGNGLKESNTIKEDSEKKKAWLQRTE